MIIYRGHIFYLFVNMTSERHFLVVVENFKVIYSPHVEMIRKYQTNVITVNSTADPFIFLSSELLELQL